MQTMRKMLTDLLYISLQEYALLSVRRSSQSLPRNLLVHPELNETVFPAA